MRAGAPGAGRRAALLVLEDGTLDAVREVVPPLFRR